MKWRFYDNAFLDIGSFLFIQFLYFSICTLSVKMSSVLILITFVTKTKLPHFQPTKFSPISYFNDVTKYLCCVTLYFSVLHARILSSCLCRHLQSGIKFMRHFQEIREIGQGERTLKSVFASFLTTSAKFLVVEGRLVLGI